MSQVQRTSGPRREGIPAHGQVPGWRRRTQARCDRDYCPANHASSACRPPDNLRLTRVGLSPSHSHLRPGLTQCQCDGVDGRRWATSDRDLVFRIRLCPWDSAIPGFDAVVPPIDASAVVHTRSSSRHPPDPLTAGLFATLTTPALNRCSLRWFGLHACRANPEDLPPSLAQHGSCRRPSTTPHSPFRTHRRTADTCAPGADQHQ
jgi:hypothetical protein